MKSFRLDRGSINELKSNWPAILIALTLCISATYLGWTDVPLRIVAVLMGGVYVSYYLQGSLTQRLRLKYPNARCTGLLSIGLTAIMFGVLTRMIFPSLQYGIFDYIWLAISFTTILTFVLINRRDPDILK